MHVPHTVLADMMLLFNQKKMMLLIACLESEGEKATIIRVG
jgi:hypothetical protein